MPIDLSYTGIVNDIMARSGVGLTLIVIIVYRLLAASVLPRLAHKSLYCVFCLVVVGSFLSLSVYRNFRWSLMFVLSLFAPCLCLGLICILKQWSLCKAILFAMLEILLFPLWFFIVFTIALLIEGGE